MTNNKSTSGFTLIEVLVTVLILSVGLLGLAGLQLVGLQNNQSALLRSQATILAYDISDRMRANITAVNAGNYNNGAAAASASCTSTTGCSPTAMAQNDLAEWANALSTQLPNGQGIVCLDNSPDDGDFAAPACGGGDIYAIKVWWMDDRTSNPKRFVMSFQP